MEHNPLLLDIIEYFVTNGLAIGDGEDCFRDFSPEDPDDVIVLYEYAGAPPVEYDSIVHRSIQVTVRSKNPDTARNKALELYNVLHVEDVAKRVDFTDTRWGQVSLRQTPFKIKIDENDRVIYGFNMGVTTSIY
jgi:hypothetical protein